MACLLQCSAHAQELSAKIGLEALGKTFCSHSGLSHDKLYYIASGNSVYLGTHPFLNSSQPHSAGGGTSC